MKKIIVTTLILGVIQVTAICFFLIARQVDQKESIEGEPIQTPSFVNNILKNMTLEQKVGQLLHIGMTGNSANKLVVNDIKKFSPGGIIQFAVNYKNAHSVKKMNLALQKVAVKNYKIPLFISSDQEGGRVKRIDIDGATQFPGAMALGQAGDTRLAKEVGFITGFELRRLGINMIFAPVLDINNNPGNPVIQTRSFGSNREIVTRIGLAFQEGMADSFSTPVIKHFPGHGDTNIDSHLDLPIIRKNIKELEQLELYPFRAAIKNGTEALMSAHILFPMLDQKYPATLSPTILKTLLRKEMGYNGLIISDAMEMKAISRRYGQGEAAVLAFAAGVDIILLTSRGSIIHKMHSSLLEAFQNGKLSKFALDKSLRRQLELKYKKGLFVKSVIEPSELENVAKLNPPNSISVKFENTLRRYKQINSFYKNKGTSLDETVSRLSIRSLRKQFLGIKNKQNIKVYYHSGVMLDEARLRSLNQKQLYYNRNKWSLGNIVKINNKKIIIIELNKRLLTSWNKNVDKLNNRKNPPLLIGLYSGNPFLNIRIPKHGAVLASFSPTVNSIRALLYQALKGPVAKADLVLPKY